MSPDTQVLRGLRAFQANLKAVDVGVRFPRSEGHAVDQLAADTLQASAVILGSWCAAGLASLVVLGGLVSAPRLTLVLSMASILLITFSGAAMLLPHGTHILAAARAPLQRQEALYWREEIPGFVQFSLGWAACAAVGLLVLTLWQRAQRMMIGTIAKEFRSRGRDSVYRVYRAWEHRSYNGRR